MRYWDDKSDGSEMWGPTIKTFIKRGHWQKQSETFILRLLGTFQMSREAKSYKLVNIKDVRFHKKHFILPDSWHFLNCILLPHSKRIYSIRGLSEYLQSHTFPDSRIGIGEQFCEFKFNLSKLTRSYNLYWNLSGRFWVLS